MIHKFGINIILSILKQPPSSSSSKKKNFNKLCVSMSRSLLTTKKSSSIKCIKMEGRGLSLIPSFAVTPTLIQWNEVINISGISSHSSRPLFMAFLLFQIQELKLLLYWFIATSQWAEHFLSMKFQQYSHHDVSKNFLNGARVCNIWLQSHTPSIPDSQYIFDIGIFQNDTFACRTLVIAGSCAPVPLLSDPRYSFKQCSFGLLLHSLLHATLKPMFI